MTERTLPDLTDTQRRILEYIEHYIAEHHYPPIYREIGEATGLRSVGSVSHQIDQLEAKRYIAVRRGMCRAITVLHSATD